MARGWESKSVEAQLEEAESTKSVERRALTAGEAENIRKRELLLMASALTKQSLSEANNPRYRQILEKQLSDLEAQLTQL